MSHLILQWPIKNNNKKKDNWHFILRGMSYLRSHHLVLWSLETLTDFQTEGTGYARWNILSPLKCPTLDMLHC